MGINDGDKAHIARLLAAKEANSGSLDKVKKGEPRPGQRAVMKSATGGNYMSYSKGGTVRHGFESKEVARAFSKNKSK